MNHSKFAVRGNLEQCSAAQAILGHTAIGLAAVWRHAIDVPVRVHGNRRIEAAALRCFSGNKQDGLVALRVDFEHYGCAADIAVPLGRAIEVTLRVPGQACKRI